MRQSTSQRLAQARAMNALLGATLAVVTVTALALAGLVATRTAQADPAPAESSSAYAHCGAYDVMFIAHDFASADDARKAAFSYLQDGCEVGRGTGRAF